MFRKNCYKCHRPSFSSSESGQWICPVCGEDLTSQRLFNAITMEKVGMRIGSFPVPKESSKKN
ncbi:hypothetical protein JOC77_000305 [Peribacillus deserti]|uniref:Uncharacterized protein n=1 Tax=Peribacillus deserti TaxID=673318 RepID=A0ABS2QCL1_9BACI|nr:hypothetical protein [Peribacillus deserti]MBM7690902.1 hypothetical protein [Peribacillus deserti]